MRKKQGFASSVGTAWACWSVTWRVGRIRDGKVLVHQQHRERRHLVEDPWETVHLLVTGQDVETGVVTGRVVVTDLDVVTVSAVLVTVQLVSGQPQLLENVQPAACHVDQVACSTAI